MRRTALLAIVVLFVALWLTAKVTNVAYEDGSRHVRAEWAIPSLSN